MLRIYEIRNKNTHRVEYIDYFADGTKPDETFRKTPAASRFVNRHDLYVYIKEESFDDLDSALQFVHQKRLDYKLIKSNIPEPPVHQVESFSFGTDPEDPRTHFRLPEEQKADIFVPEEDANPGSETVPTPEPVQEQIQETPKSALPKPKVRKPKA